MAYETREFNYDSPEDRARAAEIATEAFGRALTFEELDGSLKMPARRPRVIVGAYEGQQLVALNCFIPHDLMFRGELVSVYQSCFTATDSKHRGKGLFSRVVTHAKELFREQGVAFIIGFPNEASAPIFHTTLGFRSLGGFCHVVVPNLPGLQRWSLREPSEGEWLLTSGGYGQNDAQLVAHKRRKHGAAFFEHDHEGNYLWGRLAVRKRLPLLEIGGVILNEPKTFRVSLSRAMGAARVVGARLLPHVSSVYTRLLRQYAVTPHASHLIVCDLNSRVDETTVFNFWQGIVDVF